MSEDFPSDPIIDEQVEQQERERLNEQELYRIRLLAVEGAAASGAYGEPTRYLGATEQESTLHELPSDMISALKAGAYSQQEITDFAEQNKLQLPTDLALLNDAAPEERAQDLARYRQEARDYVAAIPASGDSEAAKKEAWLKEIDDFTVSDVINFRLYKEFSSPTLGPTAPPSFASYDEMKAYGEQRGWIEFRFGKSDLQVGYYDDGTVSEYRTTPCSPSEQAMRDEIIQARYVEIAAEHGVVVAMLNRQLNLSAYQKTAEGDDDLSPVISWRPEDEEKTKAAVSGLSAAIEDGAWISGQAADNSLMFVNIRGNDATEYAITTQRDTIRLQGGYIELRERSMHESSAHGFLWMMAATSYGLQRGPDQLATDGYTVAELVPRPVVEATDAYDKTRDVAVRRALEKCNIVDGALEMTDKSIDKHIEAYGTELSQAVLGESEVSNSGNTREFIQMLMPALVIEPDGKLGFNRETYRQVYTHLMVTSKASHPEDISGLDDDEVLDTIEQYFSRDALHVDIRDTVNAHPKYLRNAPGDREQTWKRSPIVRRMYGTSTEQFGQEVFEAAHQSYVPFDPDDPAAIARLTQQILAQGKRR